MSCSILPVLSAPRPLQPLYLLRPRAKSNHSLVADGCRIEGEVENSIIFRGVTIEKGARVSNSVLMQGTVVKSGASLAYVIADKNVTVNQDRMLMGHFTYPLAIAKESVV